MNLPGFRQPLLANDSSAFFTAKQLAAIYGFPAPKSGATPVVGVLSFGGGLHGDIDADGVLTNGDVQQYWTYQGITSQPKVIVYCTDTFNDVTNVNATSENTLDVAVIGSTCPTDQLTIILFIFPHNLSYAAAFKHMLDGIVVAGVRYSPSILSVSWGAPETSYLASETLTADMAAVNTLLAEATRNGVNICAAAGDAGASDGTTGLSASFPASCPYVLAVGGTSLVCPNGVYDASTNETVWNDGYAAGPFRATGGGVSAYFSKPDFQDISGTIGVFRNVPDIAFNADPFTGISLFLNGVLVNGIGGTSMAAPMMAGFLACVDARVFVTPLLYQARSYAFHDITSGFNYDTENLYTATEGYDQCSGLGSIIGNKVAALITPTTIDFRVAYLDSNITAFTNLQFDSFTPIFSRPDAYAYIKVPLSTMGSIFQIENSKNATEHVKFYFDAQKFMLEVPLAYAKMETTNSSIDLFGAAYHFGTQDVSATDANLYSNDFVRYISTSLFGTPNGADLFTNSAAIIDDIENKFLDSYSGIVQPLDISNGTDVRLQDGPHGKYMTEPGDFNLGNSLFQQLLYLSPQRAGAFLALPFGLKRFPFIVGDSISVYLTVQPFVGQELLTTYSAAPINPRSYRIRVIVTDDLTGGGSSALLSSFDFYVVDRLTKTPITGLVLSKTNGFQWRACTVFFNSSSFYVGKTFTWVSSNTNVVNVKTDYYGIEGSVSFVGRTVGNAMVEVSCAGFRYRFQVNVYDSINPNYKYP